MDATQWAGIMAFGGAAAACLFRPAPPARVLAAANGLMAAECALGLRHTLHNKMIWLLGEYYRERLPFQVALLLAASIAALTLLAMRWSRVKDASDTIPLMATGAALLLFALETISLHAIDRLLYLRAGPILVIGWLWIAAGSLTIISAARNRHRSAPS